MENRVTKILKGGKHYVVESTYLIKGERLKLLKKYKIFFGIYYMIFEKLENKVILHS